MCFLCWNITAMHNDYYRGWWEETWFWFFPLSSRSLQTREMFFMILLRLFMAFLSSHSSECIACTLMFVCRRTVRLRCLTYDFPEKNLTEDLLQKQHKSHLKNDFFLLFMSGSFFDEILRNFSSFIFNLKNYSFMTQIITWLLLDF